MISNQHMFKFGLKSINKKLKQYLFNNILPLYDSFDGAHDRKHALEVLHYSLKIAKLRKESLDENIIYCNAIYHDVGLQIDRKNHEKHSYNFVMQDKKKLSEWFSEKEIQLIANCCIQHRASANKKPTTLYGLILADADSSGSYNINRFLERTWNYRKAHDSNASIENKFNDMYAHLQRKFCQKGYNNIWLPETLKILKDDIRLLNICCSNKELTYNIFKKMRISGQLN